MWESPVYRFNVDAGTDDSGDSLYKQIVIDVTRSAPPFGSPGKTLSKALAEVLNEIALPKRGTILDFGAGKLRNALHLLDCGYRVAAVEYEELFHESAPASDALGRAERFTSRFSKLLFPHQFVNSRAKCDLVLLINVVNVMPIPAERLEVLRLCHQKLSAGGHLLWYTQRGDQSYAGRMVPQFRVGDGYFVGRNAKLKTFYREFTVAEIDELLAASGFDFVKRIDASPRNQARLFKRLAKAPISGTLSPVDIEEARLVDARIPLPTKVKPSVVSSSRQIRIGHPDPPELRLEALYSQKLATIPAGRNDAKRYQEHVKSILELLFGDELRDMKLEVDMFSGRRRLDIVTRNRSRDGFFRSLKDDHWHCPYIVIECKNYKHEVSNPEFDQLGSRLGKRLGKVGILAYRNAEDRRRVIARCGDIFDNDEKLIIPLSDGDFTNLLHLKQSNKAIEIESHLDAIVQEIRTH